MRHGAPMLSFYEFSNKSKSKELLIKQYRVVLTSTIRCPLIIFLELFVIFDSFLIIFFLCFLIIFCHFY